MNPFKDTDILEYTILIRVCLLACIRGVEVQVLNQCKRFRETVYCIV